jgi:hypothetical protein
MSKRLDTISINEDHLQTVLSNSNSWRLWLGRIFASIPVILCFSYLVILEQKNPNPFQSPEFDLTSPTGILAISCCIISALLSRIIGETHHNIRIHFARNSLFATPQLERYYYKVTLISNLRIQDVGNRKHEVVFNYGSEEGKVRLLINLHKHEAEKAVEWLEGSMKFMNRQSVISQK